MFKLFAVLGFLFGVARILILACIIYIYTLLPNEKELYPEFAKNSKLLPIIEGVSLLIIENFEIFDIRHVSYTHLTLPKILIL